MFVSDFLYVLELKEAFPLPSDVWRWDKIGHTTTLGPQFSWLPIRVYHQAGSYSWPPTTKELICIF